MRKFSIRFILLFLLFVLIVPSLFSSVKAANSFKDVKTSHWAYSQIQWATSNQIVKGYADGTFKPEGKLTEAQLVTILTRFDKSYKAKTPYLATGKEHYSAGYYRYFKSKHMPAKAINNLSFRDQPTSRGNFARMIAAAAGLDLTEPYAVQYLYSLNLSNGVSGQKTYHDFNSNGTLTRAEAAVFLQRLSNRGKFTIKGLASTPKGKDDQFATLPPDIIDPGTIHFPKPTGKTPEKTPTTPFDSRLAAVGFEKTDLIANGTDQSVLSLTLKDCFGNPISYEDSHSFNVSSRLGVAISHDNYYGSSTINSDGPDLIVQVTAPNSKTSTKDTLSFKINDQTKPSDSMACYSKPITMDLTYTPQAELRVTSEVVEYKEKYFYLTDLSNSGQYTYVSATIVRPGGETIYDYNGKVRLRLGSQTEDVSFVNGVATKTFFTDASGKMEATAEIIQEDIRYQKEVKALLNKTHRKNVFINPPLQISCPRQDMEMAFIIDSSGSMKRSDPDRYRVKKTQEFINTFYASKNIASHFNSQGRLLGVGAPYTVHPTIYNVQQSGGTNIGDGLEVAFNQFTTRDRKAAVLITDGKSNESKILSMVQRAIDENIVIYVIGLGEQKNLNEPLLQKVANQTGGQYYYAEENIQLHDAYQSILSAINCDVPTPSCSITNYVFTSPTIEISNGYLYMNTFVNSGCADIERVIVRFKSFDGNVDYDLVYRGQKYFAIKKGQYEIIDLTLFTEATFLAYDRHGTLAGSQIVSIRR